MAQSRRAARLDECLLLGDSGHVLEMPPLPLFDPSATWLDFAYHLRARPRAGSRPLPSVTPTRHVMERASLFRLDAGELDHLGPRSSATQIGKSSLCRFPASPKYDRYGFR